MLGNIKYSILYVLGNIIYVVGIYVGGHLICVGEHKIFNFICVGEHDICGGGIRWGTLYMCWGYVLEICVGCKKTSCWVYALGANQIHVGDLQRISPTYIPKVYLQRISPTCISNVYTILPHNTHNIYDVPQRISPTYMHAQHIGCSPTYISNVYDVLQRTC